MENRNEKAGVMPVQDQALTALAALLEAIGDEAREAFLGDTAKDDQVFADCATRAETVVRCIIGLRAESLHGASAKVAAVRTSGATVLLDRSLVDALASDMHADVCRLQAPMEAAGHA